jgi:hypothetical protein
MALMNNYEVRLWKESVMFYFMVPYHKKPVRTVTLLGFLKHEAGVLTTTPHYYVYFSKLHYFHFILG